MHQQRLIVSLVSIADKALLRGAAVDDRDIFNGFGRPTVCVTRNGVERPMQMRRLGRLPVKSERRSLGMGARQREGVRGGSVTLPQFILSFILRHRPIFEVSDFPMLMGFRFSTDRTIDSISVSFYHSLWDF